MTQADNTRKYKATHREEVKAYNKMYYDKKKEVLKTVHVCHCGGKYNYYSRARHEKTQRHIKKSTVEEVKN